jgi:hypothetical protein
MSKAFWIAAIPPVCRIRRAATMPPVRMSRVYYWSNHPTAAL